MPSEAHFSRVFYSPIIPHSRDHGSSQSTLHRSHRLHVYHHQAPIQIKPKIMLMRELAEAPSSQPSQHPKTQPSRTAPRSPLWSANKSRRRSLRRQASMLCSSAVWTMLLRWRAWRKIMIVRIKELPAWVWLTANDMGRWLFIPHRLCIRRRLRR